MNLLKVDDPQGADAGICGGKRRAEFLAAKCEAAGADQLFSCVGASASFVYFFLDYDCELGGDGDPWGSYCNFLCASECVTLA